jgi:hypothetical protein
MSPFPPFSLPLVLVSADIALLAGCSHVLGAWTVEAHRSLEERGCTKRRKTQGRI